MRAFNVGLVLIGLIFFSTQLDITDGQQQKSKLAEEKSQQLLELTNKRSVARLKTSQFKELVRTGPRDYSVVVMLTALSPARRCAICQHVHDEFLIVADSFKYSAARSDKLFFAIVDFDEASDVFQMLRVNTAPVIMHFPSRGKPKPADSMDLERAGVHAEAIAKFVQDRTDIPIRVFRPPNYSGAVGFALLTAMVGALLYVRRNNLQFLYNTQLWAVGAVLVCLAMVSGQMWNQIRGPPFFQRTNNGPVYINNSSHGQFVLESYIVMIMNGAVVVGMILLIESAGGVGGSATAGVTASESKRRRVLSVAGLVLVLVFFSLLLSVFKSKTPGYPYSLLFK